MHKINGLIFLLVLSFLFSCTSVKRKKQCLKRRKPNQWFKENGIDTDPYLNSHLRQTGSTIQMSWPCFTGNIIYSVDILPMEFNGDKWVVDMLSVTIWFTRKICRLHFMKKIVWRSFPEAQRLMWIKQVGYVKITRFVWSRSIPPMLKEKYSTRILHIVWMREEPLRSIKVILYSLLDWKISGIQRYSGMRSRKNGLWLSTSTRIKGSILSIWQLDWMETYRWIWGECEYIKNLGMPWAYQCKGGRIGFK